MENFDCSGGTSNVIEESYNQRGRTDVLIESDKLAHLFLASLILF